MACALPLPSGPGGMLHQGVTAALGLAAATAHCSATPCCTQEGLSCSDDLSSFQMGIPFSSPHWQPREQAHVDTLQPSLAGCCCAAVAEVRLQNTQTLALQLFSDLRRQKNSLWREFELSVHRLNSESPRERAGPCRLERGSG